MLLRSLVLLLLFLFVAQAETKKSGDKSDNTRKYSYFTYYHYNESYKAVESMNSYGNLKDFLRKGTSLLMLRKKDERVLQDLLLEKSFRYLTRIPVYSYKDLDEAKSLLSKDVLAARVEQFKKLKPTIKKYGSFERAIKKDACWETIKEFSEEQPECLNYSLLLKWKSGKLIKRYSYVASLDKLFDYNEYFSKYFIIEKKKFKGYRFKLFHSYKTLKKMVTRLRGERSKFSNKTSDLYKTVYEYGELVMRYDVQYGRYLKVEKDYKRAKKKYDRDKNVGSYNRAVDAHNRKVSSANKLMDDIIRDALEEDKNYEFILNRHVENLKRY